MKGDIKSWTDIDNGIEKTTETYPDNIQQYNYYKFTTSNEASTFKSILSGVVCYAVLDKKAVYIDVPVSPTFRDVSESNPVYFKETTNYPFYVKMSGEWSVVNNIEDYFVVSMREEASVALESLNAAKITKEEYEEERQKLLNSII